MGRVANCLELLLAPHYSASELGRLITRVVSTTERIQGSPLLPMTRFRTEHQANAVWERVAMELDERGNGPGNVRTDVDSIFEELALNAAQHSHSKEQCYAIVEMDGQRRLRTARRSGGDILYVVGISDGGIGIPESLRANPRYAHIASDKDAILRATELDVTGTAEQRGAGLHHVMERVRAYQGQLIILSGAGYLSVLSGGTPTVADLSDSSEMYRHGTTVLVALSVPALERN